MTMPSIIAFGICGCIFCLVLKQYQRPQSILLGIAVCCILLAAVLPQAEELIGSASAFFSQTGMEPEYFAILCKALGIAYLTQLGMDICRDCGENAIGTAVEISGRICLAVLTLPLFTTIAGTIVEVIG